MSSRCRTPARSALADPRPHRRLAGRPRCAGGGRRRRDRHLGGARRRAVRRDAAVDRCAPAPARPRPRWCSSELAAALADGDGEAAAALAPAGDAAAADLLRAVVAQRPDARALASACATSTRPAASPPTVLGRPRRGHLALRRRHRHRAGAGRGERALRPCRRRRGRHRRVRRPDAGRLPVWLAGPVVVARSPGVARGRVGAGRARPERGGPLPAAGRDGGRRRAPGAAVLAWSARRRGARLECGPGPGHGRRARDTPAASPPSPRRSTARPTPTPRSTSSSTPRSSTGCGPPAPRSCSATRPSTSPPRRRAATIAPWLVEGFADYVALRDVDLPVTTRAAQIIGQVRRDGVPDGAARPGRVRHGHHPPRGDLRERLAGLRAAGRPRGRAGAGRSLRRRRPAGAPLATALRQALRAERGRADPPVAAAAELATWPWLTHWPGDATVPVRSSERRVAAVVALVGAVAFVALAAVAGAVAPGPGRWARPPCRARRRCSRRRSSRGPRPTPARRGCWAGRRWSCRWRWSAGWASPAPGSGSSAGCRRLVVGAGAARRRPGLARRPPGDPAVLGRRPTGAACPTACPRRPGPAGSRDVAVSWAVNVVGTAIVLLVVVGTARRWRDLVAGGRRRAWRPRW